VWAVEQDEFSKRRIPTDHQGHGQDVFVPWILSQQTAEKPKASNATTNLTPDVVNRYYHMFAQGELADLVCSAATELGLKVGLPSHEKVDGTGVKTRGVTIVQDGWERSNYYVELHFWTLCS